MEVRSEPGVIPGREPFGGAAMPKPPPSTAAAQPVSPVVQSMRLSFDGSATYKPIASPIPYSSGTAVSSGDGLPAPTAAVAPVPPLHGLNFDSGEPTRRKRGRPRKYGPDGTMALALTPSSAASPLGFVTPTSGVFSPLSSGSMNATVAMESAKKKGGRPSGSSRKQQLHALGPAGVGFTPHVIAVKAGEDVSSKIMSFSQNGPRAICVLSANGAVSNVTLRQAATSGGTVTYEGRFEIISLSGSYLLTEIGGQRSRTGGLSVSLSGPDGRVLGGGVAGILTAASPVQVVVGSFIADGRKEPKHKVVPLESSGLAPGHVAAACGTAVGRSPPSHGTQSDSSGGPGSPPTNSNNNSHQVLTSMPWKQ